MATRCVNLLLTKSANAVYRRWPWQLEAAPARSRDKAPATERCASDAAGFAQNLRPASERGCVTSRTAELPGARRAWMGPPLAALGLSLPRDLPRSHPKPLRPSEHAVATMRPSGRSAEVRALMRPTPACARDRRSTTSRDGVAHEAPLSTVWRVYRSARAQREPHASTRARLENGAPVAQRPTSPSSE